jgi:hypothetical protein
VVKIKNVAKELTGQNFRLIPLTFKSGYACCVLCAVFYKSFLEKNHWYMTGRLCDGEKNL